MIRPLLFIKLILFNKLLRYLTISTHYSVGNSLVIQSFAGYLVEAHHDSVWSLNASMLLICARLCLSKTEKIVFFLEKFFNHATSIRQIKMAMITLTIAILGVLHTSTSNTFWIKHLSALSAVYHVQPTTKMLLCSVVFLHQYRTN